MEMISKIKVVEGLRRSALQTSGMNFNGGRAEIFIECSAQNEGCRDRISIIPIGSHKNEIINSITDQEAADVFISRGWKIIGHHNSEHTLCPNCQNNNVNK